MLTTAALLNTTRRIASLSWLTGPIFEKELRVSSRRRRNYVFRFVYLVLLIVFLALIWMAYIPRRGAGLYYVSRMAEAGKGITASILWFQFIVAQFVAVTALSTSISDEVRNKTIGMLMTTPVNSFQIVVGKLLSNLLQILLLLGISLPLLAIIRVFGGVPWLFVVSSLCITLTAVIFVGSLSLFFSVFSRKAYAAIILTVLTAGVIFGLTPFLTGWMYNAITGNWPGQALTTAIFYANPYAAMMFKTMMMLEPRAAAGGFPALFWPGHCGIMLGASAVLLFICVCVVRRVALHQAIGQSGVLRPKRRKGRKSGGGLAEQQVLMAPPRRVAGPPVLWKEFRTPMLGRRKILMSLAVALALIVLLITYAMCVDDSIMDDVETHIAYVVIFIALGILFTIVFPATCITSEKESRSWPLLLATTQSDWQILFGKFAGILRRCLPIWLLLFGHLVVFSLVQHIHPLAIFQMGVLVAGIVAFLSGSGLYFSARFKHSTTAVIMNFTIAAVIWALLPILIGIAAGISGSEAAIAFIASYMDTNPFVQAGVVVDGAMESLNSYYWPGLESLSAAQSSIWILACMAGYMTLGLLFAWRAKCLFRRDVF